MAAASTNPSEVSQATVQVIQIDIPEAFISTQHDSFYANITTFSQFNIEEDVQVS